MNNLTKTAKTMDRVFRILSVFVDIGWVCCLVVLGLIGACFLFGLDPSMIGTGYNSIALGPLDLIIAPGYAPDEHFVLMLIAAEAALALVCLLIARQCCRCIRSILNPMTLGEPFHNSVSASLKKLALYSIAVCVACNLMDIVSTVMFASGFGLTDLLLSEKIIHVAVNTEFDLTFLIVAGVIYLLSYVFRYGMELQQLSDETL
jgi:hypothetical protein